jgi:hypothetical protein
MNGIRSRRAHTGSSAMERVRLCDGDETLDEQQGASEANSGFGAQLNLHYPP